MRRRAASSGGPYSIHRKGWRRCPRQAIKPSLKNPFDTQEKVEFTIPGEILGKTGGYEEVMKEGYDLIQRPIKSVKIDQIEKQHFKKRMTVWERLNVLSSKAPNILYQNWGKNLDGASLVTAILNINGRDVGVYGHDFTVRAGSIDATNGNKLARLFYMCGEKGIPLIGMNDSAGAFVPAGVGGLDGYAEAFTALRKISGVVPSHHVHVRLQRRRRLLPAAPGELRHPAERHLLRPDRPRRGQVGARRGHHPRRARRAQGPRQVRRRRPDRGRRGRRPAHRDAPALLPPGQQQQSAPRSRRPAIRSTARPGRSTPC